MNLKRADLQSVLLYALGGHGSEDPVCAILDDVAAEASAFLTMVRTEDVEAQDLSTIFYSIERRCRAAAELHRRQVDELKAPESRKESAA